MTQGILAVLNYLNSILYIIAALLSFAVLILLYKRFHLGFLIFLIISAVMAMTYTVITYLAHYFPPASSSAGPKYAAYMFYSGGSILEVIGLLGCINYLRKLTKDSRTTPPTLRR